MPVICEKVTVDYGTPDEIQQLVQYDERDTPDRDACLRYLVDCGHMLVRENHPVQGPDGEPCVSWADLSDLIEPRD